MPVKKATATTTTTGAKDAKNESPDPGATAQQKTDEKKDDKKDDKKEEIEYETKFEIKVPANHELAANLKGRLLLVHGELDNNVHHAGTMRLVNALIKAGKRFDFMTMPGKPHGYGDMQPYFTQMLYEYFAEHLLGDYYRGGAEMKPN